MGELNRIWHWRTRHFGTEKLMELSRMIRAVRCTTDSCRMKKAGCMDFGLAAGIMIDETSSHRARSLSRSWQRQRKVDNGILS
jgi:hypothetical protein